MIEAISNRREKALIALLADPSRRASMEERFWARVNVAGPDDCWNWTAGKTPGGYGVVTVAKPDVAISSRLAWTLHHGSPPGALNVCHRCDNRACCNPAHLFLGTPADNMADMYRKGRNNAPPPPKGERHHSAKLTPADVVAIRASDAPHLQLARHYGVSHIAIQKVRSGRSWRDVPGRLQIKPRPLGRPPRVCTSAAPMQTE